MAIPPAGSTLPELRIDVDGDWYDGEVAITHPGILASLRNGLRHDADGYFVQTRVRIPVRVEDAPWVVTRLERQGDSLRANVNDGTVETIDPGRLRIGDDDIPRCAVKSGAFDARLSRAATFQLWAMVEPSVDQAEGVLRVGGRDYRLRRPAR